MVWTRHFLKFTIWIFLGYWKRTPTNTHILLGTMSRGITQPYQGTNLSTTVTWALLVPWSMLHGVWPFLWEFPFVGHYTLWLFNIAMENGPFIDGLPFLNMVIFHGELLHNQRVILHSWCHGGDDHALCWHFFDIITAWWCNNHLDKYESQLEGLSHILWTKCSKPPTR